MLRRSLYGALTLILLAGPLSAALCQSCLTTGSAMEKPAAEPAEHGGGGHCGGISDAQDDHAPTAPAMGTGSCPMTCAAMASDADPSLIRFGIESSVSYGAVVLRDRSELGNPAVAVEARVPHRPPPRPGPPLYTLKTSFLI